MKKSLAVVTSAALVVTTPAALASDFLEGVVGGVIGGAIVTGIQNNQNKQRAQQPKRTAQPTVSSAQRQENKKVQTSLNYFGFDVGTADGVFGRKTRTGMSEYQAYMGFPIDGRLDEFEKQTLLSSYDRAVAGGTLTVQQVAGLPDGTRGLLKLYQTPGAQDGVIVDAAGSIEVVNKEENRETGLPTFGKALAVNSMQSHCDKVTLRVSQSGGYTTLSTMTNPAEALDEQFCVARLHAMTDAEAIVDSIKDFTEEQMLDECQGLVSEFKIQRTSLSVKDMEVVLADTKDMVLQSGQSPSQLTGVGQVCMGLGYKADDPDLVVSSALMLTAVGNTPYAEVLGHHLQAGFGASQRSDLAAQWYVTAVDALNSGQNAVFAPTEPQRTALLSDAANKLAAGNADSATSGVFQVPSFSTD
ncbi:MAG: peptidoglycan-binding domain-containing protein [Pseudomonadota bacterium]